MIQDNLAEFGHSFQLKVITALLTDRVFLQNGSDLIEPPYFESQANNWIVNSILKYFVTYKSMPTNEVFKSELIGMEDKVLLSSVVDSLKEVERFKGSNDLEYIKNTTIRFCQNQKMKTAILESVDLLKRGDYDAIKKKVDTALKAGTDKDVGHVYVDDMEARYAIGARKTVKTGWELVDDLTNGGLGGGELGVVVAPAGGGKSWGLVSIAANALKQGKTVIYYTLELNQFYVGRRIDAYLTGISFQDLEEPYAKEKIESALLNVPGEMIIKYYPTRTASINTLSAHIEKCISHDKRPDLIILDYADLIRPSSSKDKRLELNDIYEDLRGLAGEHDIPIWTASQSSRSSTDDDVIEANKISESYNKIMVADFVMSLSRKLEDKLGGTGRWHIIKNRFGADGMTFPSKVNTTTGHIQIFDSNSDFGKKLADSSKGDTLLKKALSQRFNDIKAQGANAGF